MNDYQMTHLADERRRTLMAEADRERLARSSRVTDRRSSDSKPRARRLTLGPLFGRAAHP